MCLAETTHDGKHHMCIAGDDTHSVHYCACGHNWVGEGTKPLPHVTHLTISDEELVVITALINVGYLQLHSADIGQQLICIKHLYDTANDAGSEVVEGLMKKLRELARANPNLAVKQMPIL